MRDWVGFWTKKSGIDWILEGEGEAAGDVDLAHVAVEGWADDGVCRVFDVDAVQQVLFGSKFENRTLDNSLRAEFVVLLHGETVVLSYRPQLVPEIGLLCAR